MLLESRSSVRLRHVLQVKCAPGFGCGRRCVGMVCNRLALRPLSLGGGGFHPPLGFIVTSIGSVGSGPCCLRPRGSLRSCGPLVLPTPGQVPHGDTPCECVLGRMRSEHRTAPAWLWGAGWDLPAARAAVHVCPARGAFGPAS